MSYRSVDSPIKLDGDVIAVSYPLSFSVTTLPYLDKDQLGGYTMISGDIVLFNLAVDRRNGAQRATNVQVHKLIEEQKDKNARETVSQLHVHACAIPVCTMEWGYDFPYVILPTPNVHLIAMIMACSGLVYVATTGCCDFPQLLYKLFSYYTHGEKV